MADDDKASGSGKGFASGTIDLPVIGPAKKKIVFGIGGAAAAYVLWRYYQSSAADSDVVAADSDGDGFADGGVLPSVSGAVRPDNDYGQDDGSAAPSTDSYGFKGTTNSQWSQYAITQLSSSDRWSYTDIADALGQYIAGKPLTALHQQIVQAAIALAGNPPEGQKPIIPGGEVPITVAPKAPTVVAAQTTAQLTWPAVPGASSYRVYQYGVKENVGTSVDTTKQVGGLTPSTGYKFAVAAVTASGKVGPAGPWASVTTKDVALKAPTGVKVSSVTKSTARISWSTVAGATGYNVYINDVAHGHADRSPYTVVSLRPNTSYKVKVKADTHTQGPGPASGNISFRTKKK